MLSNPARDRSVEASAGRCRFRRSTRWQAVGLMALASYLAITIVSALYLNGWSTHPGKELFPFFSWSLFSRVKNKHVEYSILIHRLDGQRFDDPIDMRKAEDLPVFGWSRSLGYKALQRIGNAIRFEEAHSSTDLNVFEIQYFGNHVVDYEIMRETFDPAKRWRDGLGVLQKESLGRYRHEGRSS